MVFLVRRYDPEDAPDARIEFAPLPVEEFLKHEIFLKAEMSGQNRRRIREEASEVHTIRVDTDPVIGLHVRFKPGADGLPVHLTHLAKREPQVCRGLSIFANTEYRIDKDWRRERAVTRVLDVYGIPPIPEDPIPEDDEMALASLAPESPTPKPPSLFTTPPKKRPRKYRPKPPDPE
ncbi:hypothetical protein ASG63_08580 [Methylobacterium sp. Leaf94]|nr:hypothetical protein ASG63_08580 [Methylobacterium sp. Leaf94]